MTRNSRIVLSVVVFMIALPGQLSAETIDGESWVSIFGEESEFFDIPNAMEVDGEGNVYVIVSNIMSGTLIKYDKTGNELWAVQYIDPDMPLSDFTDMAVDDDGDIYVIGWGTDVELIASRLLAVKYDPDGNVIWTALHEPLSESSTGYHLALDEQRNVYGTGTICKNEELETCDYLTIKFDDTGVELWAARHDGEGSAHDSPDAIAVDGDGDVVVSGDCENIDLESDFCTVRYDALGTELWVALFDGPSTIAEFDHVCGMVMDGDGHVVVAGSSYTEANTYPDYVAIKYDAAGNELWEAWYDGPNGTSDYPRDIALDGDGNVLVTGYSYGIETDQDFATVKYDPLGSELWVARYDGPNSRDDAAAAVVADGDGNVIVTGSSNKIVSADDYLTVKYDPNGVELWVARYDGPESYKDNAGLVAVDKTGDVYVTGMVDYYLLEFRSDTATVKYPGGGFGPCFITTALF